MLAYVRVWWHVLASARIAYMLSMLWLEVFYGWSYFQLYLCCGTLKCSGLELMQCLRAPRVEGSRAEAAALLSTTPCAAQVS